MERSFEHAMVSASVSRFTRNFGVWALTAYFALLSGGSVIVHQIATPGDCRCLVSAESERHCECAGHGSRLARSEHNSTAAELSSSTANEHHDCLVCDFFRTAVQPVADFEGPALVDRIDVVSDLVQVQPSRALVAAYFSRGPPELS